jgi:DNA-binding XRE family transcriptional regulator
MDRVSFIALRKQYGLTQAEIAEVVEASRQAVIKWEKGLHPIPNDVEDKLLAANLAAPAAKKNATKIINAGTHPACYHALPTHKGSHARTLLHPKWWAGVGSPFVKLVSEAEWRQVDAGATVLDLAAYVAPTVEQAHEIMVSRGITFKDASRYLEYMGYSLPEHLKIVPTAEQVKNARYNAGLAEWNASHPDEPGWRHFEAAKPEYRDAPATGEPLVSFDPSLLEELDAAFGIKD